MDQELFIKTINQQAKASGINPLLLLSGIEGLYTFKNVPLNEINYAYLDSLILTIFSLRIGDKFHLLAEQNLQKNNAAIVAAAQAELSVLTDEDIHTSKNTYLQSFASIVAGKAPIHAYHIKALEAAALEIHSQHIKWGEKSIGVIIMNLCNKDSSGSLTALFREE